MTKHAGGRPSKYSQELADRICAELAQGYSLRTVCLGKDMPSLPTIFSWLRTYPEFLNQYTRAKEESADAMADEVIDIADNADNDWMIVHRKDGSEAWQLNGEHVQRSKLRIETRKWLMAKMKPKKYGDKLDMTTNGKDLPSPILGGVPMNVPKNDSDS